MGLLSSFRKKKEKNGEQTGKDKGEGKGKDIPTEEGREVANGKGGKKEPDVKEKTKRRGRDYVGESIEGDEVPEEKGEASGKTKDSKDKLETLYHCSICYSVMDKDGNLQEGVVFKTPDELAKHLFESHGISTTPEDAGEQCAIQVQKQDAKRLLEAMKDWEKELVSEATLQEKRAQVRLAAPKELEPKTIVKPEEVKDADEVYKRVSLKLSSKEGINSGHEGEMYNKNIMGDTIEVSMVKIFPKTQEVLAALNALEMLM